MPRAGFPRSSKTCSQALDLPLRLLAMGLECGLELVRLRTFGHLRQGLQDLCFS